MTLRQIDHEGGSGPAADISNDARAVAHEQLFATVALRLPRTIIDPDFYGEPRQIFTIIAVLDRGKLLILECNSS